MSANRDKPTLVLIGGADFSGSTLLEIQLASHPQVVPMGEVHALARPTDIRHLQPTCSCGENCGRWRGMNGKSPMAIYRDVLTTNPSASVCVDSSKRLSWIIEAEREAREAGWNVVHLLPWKRIKDYLHSCTNRGRARLRSRLKWICYHVAYLNRFPDSEFIPLGDLVSRPTEVLSRVLLSMNLELPSREEMPSHLHIAFGSATARLSMSIPGSNAHESAISSSHRTDHPSPTPSDVLLQESLTNGWICRSIERALSGDIPRPQYKSASLLPRTGFAVIDLLHGLRTKRLEKSESNQSEGCSKCSH